MACGIIDAVDCDQAIAINKGGIRLGAVVSDAHDQSARAMVKAFIADRSPHKVLEFASRRFKVSRRGELQLV